MKTNSHKTVPDEAKKTSASNSPFFQPKLTINQPNDIYEQEADTMADKVMRMSDNAEKEPFFKPAITIIQRKCAQCEEEEKQMHRKEINSDGVTADTSTENYINSLSGKGRSLTTGERSFFEPRFGYDFSNVQLHTNSDANQSAQSIHALAYTHDNNIVFGSNQYQPDTEDGKKLLAHELTHVVQQKENIQLKIQRFICEDLPLSTCNLAPCVATSGRSGRCFWGMPDGNKKRCHCRDTSTDEPPVPTPIPNRRFLEKHVEFPVKKRIINEEEEGGMDTDVLVGGVAAAGVAACFLSGACEIGGLAAGGAAVLDWLTE